MNKKILNRGLYLIDMNAEAMQIKTKRALPFLFLVNELQ